MNKAFFFLLIVSASVFADQDATAREPGWSMQVIATGDFRRKIQATPIEHRPYRPLHFYGNTVRRRYHRGTVMPIDPQMIRSAASAPVRLFRR